MLRYILFGGLLAFASWYLLGPDNPPKSGKEQKLPVKEKLVPANVEVPQPASWSPLKVYKNGAVCSDNTICSRIGRELLQQGGNAMDAAIGTLLCNGLVTMQSMGLGGGVFLTHYSYEKRKCFCIIGRERAPRYFNRTNLRKLLKTIDSNFAQSPLAIAVPGELAAYYEAHRAHGALPWSVIIQPSVELCGAGYNMTRHQYDALYLNEDRIRRDELLKEMFVDPLTGKFYRQGFHIKIPKALCNTLKIIKSEGARSLYNHTLANLVMEDLKDIKSVIEYEEDLRSYRVEVKEALTINIGEVMVHLPLPPGSGHVIAFILNILKLHEEDFRGLSSDSDLTALEIHRLIEALKFGFVKRWEYDSTTATRILSDLISEEYAQRFWHLLNDTKTFNNISYYGAQSDLLAAQDYGTAQVSVMSPNGDAVSATSSLNYYFGSGFMGPRTGILFNNAMTDFTIDEMPNYFGLPNLHNRNHIEPGKQPMSSMAPLIVTDRESGRVRLVIGAAGGTRIISTLVTILVRSLWLDQNIKEAIDAPRLHQQLIPNVLQYEFGVLQQIIDDLEKKGHRTERLRNKNTAVCGIETTLNEIRANADYRKEGAVDGY